MEKEVEKIETVEQLEDALLGHIGTSQYYYHPYRRQAVRTDGTRDYTLKGNCMWIWDVIITEVYDKLRQNRVLDIFYLTVEVDEEAKCYMKLLDYQDNLIWDKNLEFVTHPVGSMTTYVGWNGPDQDFALIWCLPSEN